MTTETHDSNRHNEGPWCDDCHGYTHMPWCPQYIKPTPKLWPKTTIGQPYVFRFEDTEYVLFAEYIRMEKLCRSVIRDKNALAVILEGMDEATPEAENVSSGGCCERCDYADAQEQAQAAPCCGWNVRRDYIVSGCRDKLICPDCGKEYSRSEYGRREQESHIARIHAAMASDCDCPLHRLPRAERIELMDAAVDQTNAMIVSGDFAPNFETAWLTAPLEYKRYTEENHALYWYLRGMTDEQRLSGMTRAALAEDVAEVSVSNPNEWQLFSRHPRRREQPNDD